MTVRPAAALVHLEVNEPTPIEAAVGSSVVVRLRASCPAGRARSGMAAKLLSPDGSEASPAFAKHDAAISETGDILLKVPPRIGEHIWRFVLPAHQLARTQYEEAVLDVRVRGRPQASSLAVWDVPSPVIVGAPFKVKIGAKSSADCGLKGRDVEYCAVAKWWRAARWATRRLQEPLRFIGPSCSLARRASRAWRHGQCGSRHRGWNCRTTEHRPPSAPPSCRRPITR